MRCTAETMGTEDHYRLRCEEDARHDGHHIANDPPPGVYFNDAFSTRATVCWNHPSTRILTSRDEDNNALET